MSQYAVALVFPEDISRRVDALRQEYLPDVPVVIQPHLTLVYPFTTETGVNRIKERLIEAARNLRAFDLVLDGVEFFEDDMNVAYVAIANKQPVVELHYALNQSVKGLITADWPFNFGNFVPHVTIGAPIPEDAFPKAKEDLSIIEIYYECHVDSFMLFAEGEDGVWQPEETFSLNTV